MAQHYQQVRTNEPVTTETRVVDDGAEPVETRPVFTAARLVWFLTGVLLTLLGFRFVLVLLGANPSNAFVNFIYTVSHPFAAPFFGIFGYTLRYGVSRFELSTLVAMAVYALVGYGIARLLTIRYPRAS